MPQWPSFAPSVEQTSFVPARASHSALELQLPHVRVVALQIGAAAVVHSALSAGSQVPHWPTVGAVCEQTLFEPTRASHCASEVQAPQVRVVALQIGAAAVVHSALSAGSHVPH